MIISFLSATPPPPFPPVLSFPARCYFRLAWPSEVRSEARFSDTCNNLCSISSHHKEQRNVSENSLTALFLQLYGKRITFTDEEQDSLFMVLYEHNGGSQVLYFSTFRHTGWFIIICCICSMCLITDVSLYNAEQMCFQLKLISCCFHYKHILNPQDSCSFPKCKVP